MKNEKRFVKYDKELQIEAYWFQGILQKFPQHFHEYYVLGFVEKSGLRHMCYDNVDYYITAGVCCCSIPACRITANQWIMICLICAA